MEQFVPDEPLQSLIDSHSDHVPDKPNVPGDRGLYERVAELPLVNSTLDHLSRAYAHSEASSSRLLRFGASTVRFMGTTLEPTLRTLDSYAGRQLARLESGLSTGWQLTSDMRSKLEGTVDSLLSSEAYILDLLGGLRRQAAEINIQGQSPNPSLDTKADDENDSRREEDEAYLQKLGETVSAEIIKTLKNVVELVNRDGALLPLPGQSALRSFLMGLPSRFSSLLSYGAPSRVVLMADEALVWIKSLACIVNEYLCCSTTPATCPCPQSDPGIVVPVPRQDR